MTEYQNEIEYLKMQMEKLRWDLVTEKSDDASRCYIEALIQTAGDRLKKLEEGTENPRFVYSVEMDYIEGLKMTGIIEGKSILDVINHKDVKERLDQTNEIHIRQIGRTV